MKNILILGGGFAGVDSAIHLSKLGYSVTLVSDRDYFYIYPTSIWVPTSKIAFKDICIQLDLLAKAHGFNILIDSITHIEAAKTEVTLESGKILKDFDDIIIAIGSSKMQHKGLEHTLSICSKPETSLRIKSRLEELIAKGGANLTFGFGANPNDSSAVRGGPAFELMFNIHHHLTKLKVRDKFTFTFFAPMPKPGARMGEQALKMMDKMFTNMNITKHFGKKIKAFNTNSITFEDDSSIDSDLTMFIPAGTGHSFIRSSDLPTNNAGYITIDDFSQVTGFSNIYAIGDAAALEGPDWRAKQGHVAEVMAKNVAFNIHSKYQNSSARKGYQEHLNILCVMDTGAGAGFVFRNDKRAFMYPMPVVGHWLKKGWGKYCKLSKLGKIPRIPGM